MISFNVVCQLFLISTMLVSLNTVTQDHADRLCIMSVITGPSRMFSAVTEGCHLGYSQEFVGTDHVYLRRVKYDHYYVGYRLSLYKVKLTQDTKIDSFKHCWYLKRCLIKCKIMHFVVVRLYYDVYLWKWVTIKLDQILTTMSYAGWVALNYKNVA